MMPSPENWPGPCVTMRISVATGRPQGLHLAADDDEERHVPVADFDQHLAAGDRPRRPRAAMRAICALVSVGNSRSACEGAVEANGRCGSGAFTGHPPESLSIREAVVPRKHRIRLSQR